MARVSDVFILFIKRRLVSSYDDCWMLPAPVEEPTGGTVEMALDDSARPRMRCKISSVVAENCGTYGTLVEELAVLGAGLGTAAPAGTTAF